jgi:hypothetical protein
MSVTVRTSSTIICLLLVAEVVVSGHASQTTIAALEQIFENRGTVVALPTARLAVEPHRRCWCCSPVDVLFVIQDLKHTIRVSSWLVSWIGHLQPLPKTKKLLLKHDVRWTLTSAFHRFPETLHGLLFTFAV